MASQIAQEWQDLYQWAHIIFQKKDHSITTIYLTICITTTSYNFLSITKKSAALKAFIFYEKTDFKMNKLNYKSWKFMELA